MYRPQLHFAVNSTFVCVVLCDFISVLGNLVFVTNLNVDFFACGMKLYSDDINFTMTAPEPCWDLFLHQQVMYPM